jgi:hypothetical protein
MRLLAIDVYDRGSMITIGYEQCRQEKLPSMPSHEQKLYPVDCDKDLRRDMSYGNHCCWSMG